MEFDVVEAFQTPMKDQTWVNKVVIGGLVNIVPIINFFAIGYMLTYLDGLLKRGHTELPEWSEWGELFFIGLKAFVIMVVYMIGVIILGVLSTLVGGMLGGLLAFVIFLAVMFFLPVALLRFVQEGYRIAPAFAFQEIYNLISAKKDEYILVYVIIVALCLVLGAVTKIPLLGWILGAFVFFYLSLCFCNLLTMVFSEAKGSDESGTVDPGTGA
jgi:MFS family permease